MVIKEDISLYVGTSEVKSYDASADFITEPLKFDKFYGFTINAWYNNIVGKAKGSINVEVSNDIDANSFVTYQNLEKIKLPIGIEDDILNYKYLRFNYKSNGTASGTLLTFSFTILK